MSGAAHASVTVLLITVLLVTVLLLVSLFTGAPSASVYMTAAMRRVLRMLPCASISLLVLLAVNHG